MLSFNPYLPEMDSDPFPLYARMQEEAPCLWSEIARMWFLTRYDDVLSAAQNWQVFSSSQGNLLDEIPGRAGFTLGTTDPPRHDRMRNLIQAAFTRKNLDHLADPVRNHAGMLCEELRERGQFDFVADFSSQITIRTLFAMMGMPEQDHREVRRNVILAITSDQATRTKTQPHIDGFSNLAAYLRAQVNERRQAPRDDLISGLVEAHIDGDRLEETEIVMTCATLVMAGVESLSSFMTMFALNLADHPEARDRVARTPALLEQAFEESLRLNTSAQRFKRVIRKPIELHGEKLKTGEFVALCFGAANRDPRKFPNPERYDVDRKPMGHLGFGVGKHFCLGNAMARIVTLAAMGEFLKRLPECERVETTLDWVPSTNFRSPVRLLLKPH
ncbi:MAG: cytochrome P450 [Steroidobacterales bacterium]